MTCFKGYTSTTLAMDPYKIRMTNLQRVNHSFKDIQNSWSCWRGTLSLVVLVRSIFLSRKLTGEFEVPLGSWKCPKGLRFTYALNPFKGIHRPMDLELHKGAKSMYISHAQSLKYFKRCKYRRDRELLQASMHNNMSSPYLTEIWVKRTSWAS